jgi:FkbM family methyltransferase
LTRRTPARVVSVEANPKIVPLLEAYFARLAPDSYVVEHGAIGASTMLSYSLESPAENLGATRVVTLDANTAATQGAEASPKQTITLTELRRRHGDFDLIKLDIEGGELVALTADSAWLQAFRPLLWLECNESASAFTMYDFLREIGYEVYYFACPSHNVENYLGCTQPIFPGAYEAGLLAVGRGGLKPRLSKPLRRAGCDLIKVASREDLKKCLWVTPRWAFSDWDDMPRSKLVALCGRFYRGESYGAFLSEEGLVATDSVFQGAKLM